MCIFTQNKSTVYDTLSLYFNNQCAIGLFSDSLLEILFHEGGIQAMVDGAYPAFENPIFVFDSGFNLIAANQKEASSSRSGKELIENRGFSEKEFRMANSRNHIHEKVLKSDTPILSHNPELGIDQLLCAVDTGKDMGHIVISATNRPFSEIDRLLLVTLKKCINQQMKKDEFIRNTRGNKYEYFLKDLLDGKIATGQSFLDRFNYIGKEFPEEIFCLVVETARSSDIINVYRIRNLFEKRFPDCKTLLWNAQILVLMNASLPEDLISAEIKDARAICKDNGLFAGLSNRFRSILEITEYHQQALRAIELGSCASDRPNLFIYEDYYLDHMKNIFTQKESAGTFCHPKMKHLLEYDQKHGSELAYTLYMYLTHERNLSAAAADMHMHRNSLVYRIHRIHDMIGDDYESYQERQYLILSYELNRKQ
ncbi:MAG: helix-turn-helix domain-containing protein [Clostridiales bacterium]|nr:helix-turn-helix domain-containing protein [Clostridiales bacterium]